MMKKKKRWENNEQEEKLQLLLLRSHTAVGFYGEMDFRVDLYFFCRCYFFFLK